MLFKKNEKNTKAKQKKSMREVTLQLREKCFRSHWFDYLCICIILHYVFIEETMNGMSHRGTLVVTQIHPHHGEYQMNTVQCVVFSVWALESCVCTFEI